MNKYKALLTLILSALGVFGANEYYKPKNVKDLLKWKGVKLASGNNSWKSIFFDHQKELNEFGVYSEQSLWTWCNERFKQNNLADEKELNVTKKFCSDNPKTIMGRVIRAGEESRVINKDDIKAFSINYILTGRNPEVLKLIGTDERNEIKVGKSLSEWCEKEKTVKINSAKELSKFANFKKRCYSRGVKTVSDLLKKQGKTPMISNEKYEERFKDGKFEYAKKLIEEIKPLLENKKENLKSLFKITNHSDWQNMEGETALSDEFLLKKYGWLLYKSWCEDNLKKSLLENDTYPHIYKKVSFRCTEDKEN